MGWGLSQKPQITRHCDVMEELAPGAALGGGSFRGLVVTSSEACSDSLCMHQKEEVAMPVSWAVR